MHRLAIGRSRWLAAWLTVALTGWLAGCTETVAGDALDVCTPLCRCSDAPLPGEQRDCMATCTAQFVAHPLAAPCVTCVVDHAARCPGLLDDCGPVCTQATPLGSYEQPQ
jgi:hypothetical protein